MHFRRTAPVPSVLLIPYLSDEYYTNFIQAVYCGLLSCDAVCLESCYQYCAETIASIFILKTIIDISNALKISKLNQVILSRYHWCNQHNRSSSCIGYLYSRSPSFLSPSRQMLVYYLEVGHDRILRRHFISLRSLPFDATEPM
jgi:hypothetical protein